jgi:hypothetical protein
MPALLVVVPSRRVDSHIPLSLSLIRKNTYPQNYPSGNRSVAVSIFMAFAKSHPSSEFPRLVGSVGRITKSSGCTLERKVVLITFLLFVFSFVFSKETGSCPMSSFIAVSKKRTLIASTSSIYLALPCDPRSRPSRQHQFALPRDPRPPRKRA